jgi:hypothetical protein
MMPLLLGQVAHPIYEILCFLEVLEFEILAQVMFVNYIPGV